MGLRSGASTQRRQKLKEWPTRRIALLVLPGIHLTTLAGPLDVFTRASAALSRNGTRRSAAYEVELLTADEMPLMIGPGFGLVGGRRWSEAGNPIDTLLVLASFQSRIDPDLLSWLRASAPGI